MKIKTLTLCPILLLATPASADDTLPGAGGLLPLAPEIIVTANRRPQTSDSIGQSVTIIDDQEIRARQSQAVSDLLRTTPGVTVARNGGIGGVGSVFIRGADSDQTLVLIDGIKLNDPASPGAGFNFGTLLTGNISRIEVVRGSQSVIWGSQAIGGVINLLTTPPTETLVVNARAEYGWRNTTQLVANASGRVGPAALSLGGGWFRSDGISSFSEARGGRERDGHENFGLNSKLLLSLSDTVSLDLRGFYSSSTTGIDGFPPPSFSFADTPEQANTREFVGYAGLNAALFEGRLQNRLGFAYTAIDRDNRNAGAITFEAEGRNERLEYQGVLDLGSLFGATFGAETERSRYQTASGGGAPSGATARINSAYAEATLKPVAALALTAGLRHDDHNRFGGATTFSANGVISPNAGQTLIRASYGEGFKAPSLFQLFSNFGNAILQPERSQSVDAGIVQRLLDGAMEISATWFHRDTENQIDFVSCFGVTSPICVGRPFGTYDNIRASRAHGLETALTLRPTKRLVLRAQYSHINARDRTTGRRLARRPSDSVSAVLDWQSSKGWSAGATIAHVGASFENAANSVRLPGHVLVDIRAAMPITSGLELYARIENLFDERYETVFRFGAPGRAGHAGVRLKI